MIVLAEKKAFKLRCFWKVQAKVFDNAWPRDLLVARVIYRHCRAIIALIWHIFIIGQVRSIDRWVVWDARWTAVWLKSCTNDILDYNLTAQMNCTHWEGESDVSFSHALISIAKWEGWPSVWPTGSKDRVNVTGFFFIFRCFLSNRSALLSRKRFAPCVGWQPFV